jgi:serine/threonine-protein kinase
MPSSRKVIARRDSTAVAGMKMSGRTSSRVPEEFLSDQVRRLAVFAIVATAVWTFGLLMETVIIPMGQPGYVPSTRVVWINVIVAALSALMWLFVRQAPLSTKAKIDVGLGFMLLNGLGIALLNAWARPPLVRIELHVSWATVLILVYSMIAPSTPRRTLFASIAAAAMDPVAFTTAKLLGLPGPAAIDILILTWPNFACAVIAMLPSRVLERMGRRLREAQDMGSYHLVELLGHGGMGEVWRAEHRLLARHAAIKLVRPEVLGARNEAEGRAVRRRFEREAQATAALSSPNSIQLFDFGVTEEGTFYYVMELLAGRDLESLVREFGPLPSNRAIYLLRQVCHSLADAHARGLVHRDIKPANIYLCRMGLEYDFVKVLDFGLVKFKDRARRAEAGRDPETLVTIDHTTTGTPAYMAPETILGDIDVDRRADVYALGCVAYYLLTGQLVFEADTSMKMLLQHLHAEPVRPSVRSELPIPQELDDLVMACLQKDPNLRPQNAGELFRMASRCRADEMWDQDLARQWWLVHLPEFTGPLTVGDPHPEPARKATTV